MIGAIVLFLAGCLIVFLVIASGMPAEDEGINQHMRRVLEARESKARGASNGE